MKNLAIIGAGSWGTALAIVLAPRFPQLRLWVYEADLAARMRISRENDVYLPGFQLADHVEVVSNLPSALEGAEVVLSVMPSHLVRRLYQEMLPSLDESMLFVSATKGLENGSLLRMSEVCLLYTSGPHTPAGIEHEPYGNRFVVPRELGDGLFHPVIEELEVFFLQTGDRSIHRIADCYRCLLYTSRCV